MANLFERLAAGRPPAPEKTTRPELSLPPAQKLLNWLQQEWPEPAISAREIRRLGPRPRDRKTTNDSTEILIKYGWLVPLKAHRYDRKLWKIVRTLPSL